MFWIKLRRSKKVRKIFLLLFLFFVPPVMAEGTKSWKTDVEVGYSLNSGNTDTENIHGALTIKYFHKNDELILHSDGRKGKSNGKKNEERYHGNINYDKMLTQKVSVFALSDAENDKFRKLDYRINFGGGAKYTFAKDDVKNVSLSAALLYELEHTLKLGGKDKITRFSVRPKVKWKILDESELSTIFFYQPGVDHFKDYRLHSETSLTVPMNNHLLLKTSFVYKYNNLPETGVKYSDSSLLTSLVLSF